jgi:Ca2+:H+ antiporter
MSACLLCLSVLSLVLPTAFHASFDDPTDGTRTVLKVSRGTSVVLLLVYCLYLVFSLKSHSFMYASTPQHLIDEESQHPGVLAEILNSSSSSDSSSSSSSDSDSSRDSRTTAKKIKRAFRRRRRRSVSSKDNASVPSFARTLSDGTNAGMSSPNETGQRPAGVFESVLSGDEADMDGEGRIGRRRSPRPHFNSRDFESSGVELNNLGEKPKSHSKRHKRSKQPKNKNASRKSPDNSEKPPVTVSETKEDAPGQVQERSSTPHITIIDPEGTTNINSPRRPFTVRNFSEAVHAGFNSTVFPHHEATGRPLAMPIQNLRPPSQPRRTSTPEIRRTSSMPDMIHPTISNNHAVLNPTTLPTGANETPQPQVDVATKEIVEEKHRLSTTSSVVTLVFTTGFVALCAEFLVGSLDYIISTSGVSQAFIGLIILPLVGNAAEHVTAVTVAAKNKMDLAIGIALGSSIQIAIFVTPLMVILGWIIGRDMSLYFSLFETVSLFASALIVSFILIDGRSNYLEGALLMAAYIIIAVSAFYYPSCDLSTVSGPQQSNSGCTQPGQTTLRFF